MYICVVIYLPARPGSNCLLRTVLYIIVYYCTNTLNEKCQKCSKWKLPVMIYVVRRILRESFFRIWMIYLRVQQTMHDVSSLQCNERGGTTTASLPTMNQCMTFCAVCTHINVRRGNKELAVIRKKWDLIMLEWDKWATIRGTTYVVMKYTWWEKREGDKKELYGGKKSVHFRRSEPLPFNLSIFSPYANM